jgi:signal transduction histidine kinase
VREKISRWISALTFAQRFTLASFIILLVGMAGLGAWVGKQIEQGVVHRTAATTALYVDSFIAPDAQELAAGNTLTPDHVRELNWLLNQTTFGQRIAQFKLWTKDGQIAYAADPAITGMRFPIDSDLAEAFQGEVAASISDLSKPENVEERQLGRQLLEMYTPVRQGGSEKVIAVAEFYYTVDELNGDIASAEQQSWLVVAGAGLLMFLLLAGFVRQASNTITGQRSELSRQVARLQTLLAQNAELSERVQRAAARTTALNERFLRRISAELHDGPAQDLGLALLRLDHVLGAVATQAPGATNGAARNGHGAPYADDLELIESSLRRAMHEVRGISTGLGLPDMERWTLKEVISRVVSAHERRTKSRVRVQEECLSEHVELPVKITLYRLIQEALTNAYRHGKGEAQTVLVRCTDDSVHVEVSDAGPGFDAEAAAREDRLGISGMRQRVESLGGQFRVESAPGQGAKVIADLALAAREDDER